MQSINWAQKGWKCFSMPLSKSKQGNVYNVALMGCQQVKVLSPEESVKRRQNQVLSSGAQRQEKLIHRRFLLNIRKHVFTVRVTEHWTGCPESLWSLQPCRYSKAVWAWSWAIVCKGLRLSRGSCTRWPPEVPSKFKHSMILWQIRRKTIY